jgi:hypothetical protein
MVNIKAKMCENCGLKQPSYNFAEKKVGIYCGDCRLDGMVLMKRSLFCIICDKKQASFNLEGMPPRYCSDCRSDDMIDTRHARCEGGCGLQLHGENKWCANCDKGRVRNARTKERKYFNFLAKSFKPPTRRGPQIPGSKICGQHIYIDGEWLFETHDVNMELDEYQHASYKCDIRRMVDAYNSKGGIPQVFLRVNPDAFKVDGKTYKMSTDLRKRTCLEQLQKWSDTPPEHALVIVRLCYDGAVLKTVSGSWDDGKFVETEICNR